MSPLPENSNGQTARIRLRRIPVLLYHRIDTEAEATARAFCVPPPHFAEQMQWLADHGFTTIHLGQILDYYRLGAAAPPRPIVITFDDGFFCNYSRAFPILQRHGFSATVFLACNLLRHNTAKPGEGRNSFMAWPEILAMQQAGWEFHSHGLDHRRMTELTRNELIAEVSVSRQRLTARLSRPVEFFCYPFGQFNSNVQKFVRAAGYRGACGGPPFDEHGPLDDYAIGRTEILWGDSLRQFIFKIEHGLGYYYYAKKQLGKIKHRLLPA
jgi:peptidoglycan/xylan/chitin deacetylase (PgdA/CDA1 family)